MRPHRARSSFFVEGPFIFRMRPFVQGLRLFELGVALRELGLERGHLRLQGCRGGLVVESVGFPLKSFAVELIGLTEIVI